MVSRRTALLSTLLLIGSGGSLLCAKPPTVNAMYVKNMHCEGCAKRLRQRLYKLPNVLKVSTDVKKGVAIVVPVQGKTVSARSLWLATESEKFQIAKLTTPSGTFTQPPKQ